MGVAGRQVKERARKENGGRGEYAEQNDQSDNGGCDTVMGGRLAAVVVAVLCRWAVPTAGSDADAAGCHLVGAGADRAAA